MCLYVHITMKTNAHTDTGRSRILEKGEGSNENMVVIAEIDQFRFHTMIFNLLG